ncbi:MAG: ammonium transporter [Fibrobacterota bacterium]|nr:ammonium transporter [Fibrobacterota bacterium]
METAVATLDTGDTAWMLISTAMVLFMIPGLALFYGGLTRSKNMLGTMMHSFITMGAITLQWMVVGYSLAFGEGNGFIGSLDLAFLRGIRPGDLHGTIPVFLWIAFQGTFACITPALISGAIAERIKFGPYIVFILLWSTLVYDPVCHWVWHPDGFLAKAGTIDFAGGLVVHLTSGIAGLVACIILGKRHGLERGILPHNMVHVVLGTGILWFGWFGFNAGSAVGANGTASLAFLNTFVGPAAGICTWLLIEKLHLKKSSALGGATGAIAGLAAVTPAAGSVLPFAAMGLAAVTAAVCYLFVAKKQAMGYDDALDAFGVHGIAGILGPLAIGVIASQGTNSLLFHSAEFARSGVDQFLVQLKALLAVGGYSLVVTGILVVVIEKTMGFRVDKDIEEQGLDLSLHGERAYNH